MKVQFVRANVTKELRSLVAFDRKVFRTDAFDRGMWPEFEVWWMFVDKRRAGCSAFERDISFDKNGEPIAEKGTVYIATTGILPALQGQGLGRVMKAWQIAWARRHGFQKIVTNHRASNKAIIALNRSFGFRRTCRIPGYYTSPDEAAVSMALVLTPQAASTGSLVLPRQ